MTFPDYVKTLTRPVLTFTGLVAWIAFIEAGVDYPEIFQTAVVGMLVWWFGERTLTHLLEKKNGQ